MARFITKSVNQRRTKKWYIKDTAVLATGVSVANTYNKEDAVLIMDLLNTYYGEA